jgi:Dr1-associated corepressor
LLGSYGYGQHLPTSTKETTDNKLSQDIHVYTCHLERSPASALPFPSRAFTACDRRYAHTYTHSPSYYCSSSFAPHMGKRNKGSSAFPVARIKKMMQSDEEVGKIATSTPILVGKALECMLEDVLSAAAAVAHAKRSKTVSPAHLREAVEAADKFDFLRATLAKAPRPDQNTPSSAAPMASAAPPAAAVPAPPRAANATTIAMPVATTCTDRHDPEYTDPKPSRRTPATKRHKSTSEPGAKRARQAPGSRKRPRTLLQPLPQPSAAGFVEEEEEAEGNTSASPSSSRKLVGEHRKVLQPPTGPAFDHHLEGSALQFKSLLPEASEPLLEHHASGVYSNPFSRSFPSCPIDDDDDENYDDEVVDEGTSLGIDPNSYRIHGPSKGICTAGLLSESKVPSPPMNEHHLDVDVPCVVQSALGGTLEPIMFAPAPRVVDPLPMSMVNAADLPSLVRQSSASNSGGQSSASNSGGQLLPPSGLISSLDSAPPPFALPHIQLQNPTLSDKDNRADHTSSERVSVHALLS